MRLHPLAALLLGPAILLSYAATRAPAVPTVPQEPGSADMAAMMAKAKRFTEPGPSHALLERFVGSWQTESSFVMGGKKAPPELGEAEVKWLMPGRWLQMDSKGKMMQRPFESHEIVGYDNFKQSFVCTVVNSFDTAMLRSEGDMTRDGKAMILYGTMDEYLTGEHDKMVKYVYRFVGDDKIVSEVHDLGIGEGDSMVLEITMTRRK